MNDESEREDGEIVDDDDMFEAVSDCSISSAFDSGKSPTYQDNISIVSLSSISANDEAISSRKRSRNSSHRRKRKYKHSRKRRGHEIKCHKYSKKEVHSTTDEEDRLNRTVLKQLREAVRINSQPQNNNLECRLKQMLNVSSKGYANDNYSEESDDDAELEKLRSDALSTKTRKNDNLTKNKINGKTAEEINGQLSLDDTMNDNELVELRLAALKSAVIQKHIQRKKRKEEEQHDSKVCNVKSIDETNKENAHCEIKLAEANIPQTVDKEIADKQDNEEDTDKIINNVNSTSDNLNITEEDEDIMRAKLLASMAKKFTSINNDLIKKPIINSQKIINTNIYKSSIKMNKKIVNYVQSNTIVKIPTANVKPLVININDESDSDSDIEMAEVSKPNNEDAIALKVTEFLKKTRAEAEANKSTPNSKVNASVSDTSDSILTEKSVVKLLPKSQQQEYRILKQKLLNAKRKRARKPSLKQTSNTNKNIIESHNHTQQQKKSLEELPRLNPERNAPAQVADRLQMKGKYQELGPLIERVNEASTQKKKIEQQIKRLLGELKQSRKLLEDSQNHFSRLVKELILRKDAIDKRINNKFKHVVVKKQQLLLPSSTPLKETKGEIVTQKKVEEKAEVVEEVKSVETQTNHDQVNNNNEEKGENFPEYISPLGPTTRNVIADPLGTFCPYEIFGVCKDPECTYKHYS